MASENITIKVKRSTLWLLRQRYGKRLGTKSLIQRAIRTIEFEEAQKFIAKTNESSELTEIQKGG